ncbi:Ribonuclease P protein subunit p30 [Phytophthora pseudosyringae]|uniref:Ribonuclease P protein subunit p30 n=1 Tax=Phytophthora pseudosyringae TaxID=221518 RepID=A0A8T1VS60_9STRA|nr:Ribonuclease P protein subunit p30 [Phytophthora pseudosyringae]
MMKMATVGHASTEASLTVAYLLHIIVELLEAMVYVDLNVRATARVSAGELQRLGYATVCVNVDCEGNEKPKPVTALPDLPQSAQKDKSGKAAKKAKLYTAALGSGLHLKDANSTEKKELPRQRKRITLKLEEVADAQKLVRNWAMGIVAGQVASDVVKGYDIVAAEAATPKVFQFLCEQAEIDLITFDVTNRLPFQIKRPLIAAAVKRGIYFEITYTPCLGDTAGRRYFFSNASNLVRLTGGKNLVFSSGATRDILLRSPYDVVNIGLLSGLKYGQALDAISTSCLAVLEHADKRRGIIGGVQVEATEDVAME